MTPVRSSRSRPQHHPRPATVIVGLAILSILWSPCGADIGNAEIDRNPAPDHIRDMPLPDPATMGPDRPIADLDLPTTPPDDPQIGDSWVWWLWVHDPMPPHWEQRVLTVRGRGDHAYIVIDDAEWNVDIDQADVDLILERWENSSIGDDPDMGIYEINSTYFGEPPDEMDDDPRVYIVWFDFGISSDGFFFFFDQYPEGTFPGYHSNECESLYLNTDNGQSPSGDYMISVVAHEFEHMIHWKYDEDEDLWVDEGMAELAMYFYGRPDVIAGFNTNPDDPLPTFEGDWADYIKTYLWSLYFFEQYGGYAGVYDLVHEPFNGLYGYDTVLAALGYSETTVDVFADWAVANFLDDTSIGDGRFGYYGDDLPPFNVAGTYDSYPVGNQSRAVNQWATDYYRFQDFSGFTALVLDFDGIDSRDFAIWGLALYGDGSTGVYRMTLDEPTQSGTLAVPGLHDPADEVILVVACVSNGGYASYVFSAAAGTADVADRIDDGGILQTASLDRIVAAPNPFRGETTLKLSAGGALASGPAALDLFDTQGRLVRSLPIPAATGSSISLVWDGRQASGDPVAPGIYYAQLRGANGSGPGQRLLRLR